MNTITKIMRYSYIKFLFGISFFVGIFCFGLFFITDVFAFHQHKTIQLNNEITQDALEVEWYLNQTEKILNTNNSDISEALSLLHMAQVKLGFLKNWHSNSTIAQLINELEKETLGKKITTTMNLPPIPSNQLPHSSNVPLTTTTIPGQLSQNNLPSSTTLSSASSKLPSLPSPNASQSSIDITINSDENKTAQFLNTKKQNDTLKFDDTNLRKAFPELDQIISQDTSNIS